MLANCKYVYTLQSTYSVFNFKIVSFQNNNRLVYVFAYLDATLGSTNNMFERKILIAEITRSSVLL